MSKMSKIVEFALDKKNSEYFEDAEKAKEHLQKRSLEEDEPYKLPKRIYHSKAEIRDMFGCQMLTFKGAEEAESLVIYLHGEIYVNEIMNVHVAFCDKLAKKANACVYHNIARIPQHLLGWG
ncbi:hypothetical protein [Methanobrevibacter millerae]|nr:hypothetical protein [Methanobrevibacter millerae]